MNEKRAKRLRQLVKHLMGKDAIAPTQWTIYADVAHKQVTPEVKKQSKYSSVVPASVTNITGTDPRTGIQIFLDEKCGRAIYQAMKKRDKLAHR